MNPTNQLKADLTMILSAAKQDTEVSDPVKRHLGELVAWCEAHLDHSKDLADRLESAEAGLNEIIQGDGEMIFQETATEIGEALAHTPLLCQAALALIEGPLAASLDEMSKKRFKQLIENAKQGISVAAQRITELVVDDQGQEDDDGLGDDGAADADAGDETEADVDG